MPSLLVIKFMAVFCVHAVLEHQEQKLDLPASSQLSSSRPGQVVWSVRKGGIDRPSQHKSHPAGSLSFSQPRGPSCAVISLFFGLIGHPKEENYRAGRAESTIEKYTSS